MKRIALTIMLALTGLISLATAGPGYWSGNGPFGGVVYEVVPRPGSGGTTTIYAITQSGLFRTVDGGISWQRSDQGIPGGASLGRGLLSIDDLLPDILRTADGRGRIFRSIDGGDSWTLTGYSSATDVAPLTLVDVPGNSNEMYLGQVGTGATPPTEVLLLKSNDGGTSFAPLGGGLPTGRGWSSIAVDPSNSNRILAGARYQPLGTTGVPAPPSLYLSVDGGITWTSSFTDAAAQDYVPGVEFAAFGAGDTVYIGVDEVLYRSDDNGANWIGPLVVGVLAAVPHPTDALSVLLASDPFYGGAGGVLRSTDGGVSASPINTGLTPNPSYTSSITATLIPAFVYGIAADALYPAPGGALWVATNGGGVFRSLDDGANWQAQNEGLASVKIRALAVHPNPSTTSGPGTPGRRIYAGFGDTFYSSPALYLSSNLGDTWQGLNSQLRAGQIRALAVDPTTAGLSLADVASSHVYAFGRSAVASGYRNGGLYKSINGGITWSTIDASLPTRSFGGEVAADLGTVRYIALDPRSCTIPLQPVACSTGPLQRVYATATGFPVFGGGGANFTHRIIRSDDAGATWAALDAGLPPSTSAGGISQQIIPLPLAISPTNANLLYVGTFASYNGVTGSLFEDRESGVFKSTDGGLTWTQVSNGLPRRTGFVNTTYDVLAMAMHPANHDILWATQFDSNQFTAPGGVAPLYKTVDGGTNWLPSSAGLPPGIDLRAIIVDRTDPETLYVGGYFPTGDDGSGSFANPPGVYKSTDGGATWLSISTGLQARSVLEMAIDPFYPSVLHVGSNSGVWTIEQVPDTDGDGVPDDVENLAPNSGDGDSDGVQDGIQGSVGSTVVLFGTAKNLSDLKSLATTQGAGGFVTSKVETVLGTCAQAVDVEVVLAARFGRDYAPNATHFHAYPRNLARFEVLDCEAASVDLIFHGANFVEQEGWSFRLYGPPAPGNDTDVGWHDISARAEVVSPSTWRLSLDADEPGSFRLDSGSILFMGGPACLDERIFEGVFESDWVRPPSCQ